MVCKDNSLIRYYLNGVQVYSTTSAAVNSSGYVLSLGGDTSGSYFLGGNIGWFHIIKGTNIYPNGTAFTPPVSPIPVVNSKCILVPGDSPKLFFDRENTYNPKTITRNGNAIQSLLPPSNKALSLSGANYLSFTSEALGLSDFTIDLFAFYNGGTYMMLFDANTTPRFGWYWYNNNTITIGADTVICNFTAVVGNWYHFAWVRKSGVSYMYVNGSLIGSVVDTRNYVSGLTYLGTAYNQSAYSNGKISNVRVTKGLARWTKPFQTPRKY